MMWSYIAGFFDGEGSITHNGKGFRITITQTNKKVLESIKNFTRVGNVIEVTKRQKHWKDSWIYFISTQQDIYYFLKNIQNYLIVKKYLTNRVIPQLKNIITEQQRCKEKRRKIIKQSKILRYKGLTYRQIGKILKIDWGYARRLTLKKLRCP